ncbi:cytochrome P450 [Nonomuraea endophytica]|uniref:Fatty-acid peroxygenase n=1 Tax=Nonomuraea endophytica TaxID=714136 RepID=A0A7W8AF79_9ACTN|nr:cytochrome P450 [Nonomuraea endophytica]MBB5085087.1 fatty-acid peroxygenase [Nonomuraea endophytica]
MTNPRPSFLDETLSLLTGGYAWLPGLWRRRRGGVVRTRVLGRRTVALRGPEAVRFFYDERHMKRHGALPEPVQATLTGKKTVHSLDGPEHRARKHLFLSALADPGRVTALAEEVGARWDERVRGWPAHSRVVVFDEAAKAITEGVCAWAGVPLPADEADALAADMVALVDGFGGVGPRHWKARRARVRREKWLAGLLSEPGAVPAGSVADLVARHRGHDGEGLEPELAATELLNIIRPTVAVAWYVAFAAHALHRWPDNRARLLADGFSYADAFAQEVRRFYPIAPFVGAFAVKDLTWQGEPIPEGALVLLDLYGQNHDGDLWARPYSFEPGRFVGASLGRDDLVPQGGGDPHTGHRCPGEAVTVALLRTLAVRLARLDYMVPRQDLTISLRRVPTRPRSGFVITDVRGGGAEPKGALASRSSGRCRRNVLHR